MNPIITHTSWMAKKFQPEYVRLFWLVVSLVLYLLAAGAPITGGGLGE